MGIKMIVVKEGNIFNGNEKIICHQTNCLGIMGGGIALQVRNRYPEVYKKYSELCSLYKDRTERLMGNVQFVETNDGKIIANCFGQNGIGNGVQTDYNDLYECLKSVKTYAEEHLVTVSIPYNIGCGLAGGDWNIVSSMIEEIFGDSDVPCTIYQYKG